MSMYHFFGESILWWLNRVNELNFKRPYVNQSKGDYEDLSEVNVNFMSQIGGTLDIQAVIMIDNFYKCLVLIGKAVK